MFDLTAKKKRQIVENALKKIDSKVDKKQLTMGVQVELEHSGTRGENTNVVGKDGSVMAKIAIAHLHEDPKYYDHLAEMEDKYQK